VLIAATLGGVLVLVTGALTPEAAGDVVLRLAPILVSLVALSELADASGPFDAAARECAHRDAPRPGGCGSWSSAWRRRPPSR